MNYLDIIITTLLLYALVKGFSNGLIKEVLGFFSLLLGTYVAFNFSKEMEPKIIGFLGVEKELASIVSFAVLFLLVVVIFKLIRICFDKLTSLLALGIVNRFLGSIFGVLKVGFFCGLILYFGEKHGFIDKTTTKNSILYKPTRGLVDNIIPKLTEAETILEEIQETLKKKGVINQE